MTSRRPADDQRTASRRPADGQQTASRRPARGEAMAIKNQDIDRTRRRYATARPLTDGARGIHGVGGVPRLELELRGDIARRGTGALDAEQERRVRPARNSGKPGRRSGRMRRICVNTPFFTCGVVWCNGGRFGEPVCCRAARLRCAVRRSGGMRHICVNTPFFTCG